MALLGTKSIAEVREVLMGSLSGTQESTEQRVIAKTGEEDRWMQTVREAGKA